MFDKQQPSAKQSERRFIMEGVEHQWDKTLEAPTGSKKPRLAFSIDSILGRDESGEALPRTTRSLDTMGRMRCVDQLDASASLSLGPLDTKIVTELPWLSYSRYSPPKLPRSRRRSKTSKRRSSGSPRVPFTTGQLMSLEEEYSQNRYLSTSQVTELASSLNLPQHRIKIWFQNRRAREKRSQEENSILNASGDKHSRQTHHDQLNRAGSADGSLPCIMAANISLNCAVLDASCLHCERLYRCVDFNAYRFGTTDF